MIWIFLTDPDLRIRNLELRLWIRRSIYYGTDPSDPEHCSLPFILVFFTLWVAGRICPYQVPTIAKKFGHFYSFLFFIFNIVFVLNLFSLFRSTWNSSWWAGRQRKASAQLLPTPCEPFGNPDLIGISLESRDPISWPSKKGRNLNFFVFVSCKIFLFVYKKPVC